MKNFCIAFALCLVLLVTACGGSKNENVYEYPDNDSAKADSDVSEPADSDEPGEPADSDELEDSDEPVIPVDQDQEGPDSDSGTPADPKATENHKISGMLQAGIEVYGVKAALVECGKSEEIASANTDENGRFSFNADISSNKTYCVKAGDLASCFKGLSDHVANISEITTAAYLIDDTCSSLRKSEIKVRAYTKLGTGAWLGELDYSKLSGISEGLKILSSLLGTNDAKTLSEKIAADVRKSENREFVKLFNGFAVFADKTEIVIGETADNSALFSVEGGSTEIAPGFKIRWSLKNKTDNTATYSFSASTPGEYTARAKLVYDGRTSLGDPIMFGDDGEPATDPELGDPIMGPELGDPIMITEDSATVLFLQRKNGGTVYVSDTSKHISFRIDDGIYGVIPKGTVVKKNGSKINSISYDVLSAGGGKVSRLKFRPEGAVFEGDSMYFVHELGTVFGGDPIMLSATRLSADGTTDVMPSAGGDPVTLEALGDPIMFTALGDPIMQVVRSALGDPIMDNALGDPIMANALGDPIMENALGDPIMSNALGDPIMGAALGDPIMGSALGDPIMGAALGDPIMMGTSSSAMISQTNHYSTFTVEAASLPVSVDALVSRWCDGSFYRGYSPVEFIRTGVEKYKPEGEGKTRLLSYLTCERLGDLGSDLYELVNRPVGFQRNLNLFENLFFVSEFYNRMKARQEGGTFAAVRNGLELRSAIAALYTATTSYNRSATLADMLDPSMIPLTYSGVTPEDYTAAAAAALTGNSGQAERYATSKKEMMIFANYITTSSKGPDFSSVSTMLTPDQLVCAWFNPGTPAQNCSKVYTLNEAGHVTLGGTEVSAAEANAVFTEFFMPMNTRLSDSEKLDLFRTLYLALKYAGTVFYNGSDVEAFNEALLKTAYLVFDGIDGNANAVTITDTFDASAHTVQVLDGSVMEVRPYVTKLSALTDRISLKVAAANAEVEKVLIGIEGREFEKVQENTRTYYTQTGELKEKTIVLAPGTLAQGEKALKDLLGNENIDELGNITGKMTIVVNSKISGRTYTTQRSYDFFANDDSDGVNSKPVPANIRVFVNDPTGRAIPAEANPTIILNPGSRVFYPTDGVVSIENLTPAAYTVEAFAEGYYAKSVSVNVPAGAAFSVEVRLDEEITSSADAELALSVRIETKKHPSKVYIQIYNDDMDLVANEAAKFNGETNRYDVVNIPMNSGRYTLLAVGEEMYRYLEAITLYEGSNEKTITVVAKNACGNGIVDSAEECEPSAEGSVLEVLCGEIYPASTHPGKTASCDPDTCTFNKTECGKAAYCGDGIIDAPSEGCDGGAKDCSEIAGFGGSTGSARAPCAPDCSGYITADNCSKTTAGCGSLPANAVWNDGEGRFTQKYDGTNWLPASKAAAYGDTKEECVFSCAKGYRWNGTICDQYPLSLGRICTGAEGCFDETEETACPAYGTSLFGQDAQYAAADFCTPRTLSAAGSGIVKDAYTHYEWQSSSSASAMNWTAANKYCSDLNNESGSSAMWRLPSPTELLTIADSGTASPALGGMFTAYGHTFWAAEDARNSGNAWIIDENGALESVRKTASHSVICVRVRDYDAPGNRFTATAETVRDNESGLMWQKQAVASRTWAEALNYCGEVSTGEKYDWRLPNRNELASLVDYTKADGAASDFPAIAAKGFWTSTTSINENAKAWTVDFESGRIEAAEKTNTKYIICVRNDEQCFGGECPDPCGFDPCVNTANSTGLCTASDYSFTCGCKSGFNWSHGKCLLDTTRYIACEGLPENAVWNTVFGISQRYDGEKWYPSNIGSFDKTKSSTECHFICNANYDWDPDGGKCVAQTKLAECTGKPAKSVWNTADRITQSWNGDAWEPSNTAVFSENSCTDQCCFKCKEHFHWDNENNCVADTQEVACTGLPADGTAQWWKDPGSNSCTVIQTWNDDYSDWYPTASATYKSDGSAGENGCFFKCKTNYKWNPSYLKCEPQTNYNVACKNTTLPENAEWNQFSTVNQTWNGSAWIPSTNGTYNETPSPDECRFKCKLNYTWNDTNCVADTRQAECTGLRSNASWVNSVITQTWSGSEWLPTTAGNYADHSAGNECLFECNEHYYWHINSCVAESLPDVPCDPATLPENAVWYSTSVTQTWNGFDWMPTTVGTYKSDWTQSDTETGCFFKCKENYNWNQTYRRCDPETREVACGTLTDDNAEWNVYTKITQTWNGTGWTPSTSGTYNEIPNPNECRFKCKTNYTWSGESCVADTRQVKCVKNAPHTTWWNDNPILTQTWNGSAFVPEQTTGQYSPTAPTEDGCFYKCEEHYVWGGSSCEPETQSANCENSTLPAHAEWWKSTVSQTWNEAYGDWYPTTSGTYKSHWTSSENGCYFQCKTNYRWNQAYRNCEPAINYNVACDDSTLPDNAEWNVFSTINQTWNGTVYWPPTTGTYNETPNPDECRFKCKNHYSWDYDLLECLLDKRMTQCTGTLPGHAVWTVSQIAQEWSLSDEGWMPRENEMIFNDDTTINKCSFKCAENYTWKDNLCIADKKQDVPCEDLPANAIWNTTDRINQEWTGEAWYPSEHGLYNEEASNNECRFKCSKYHFWTGNECKKYLRIGNICTGVNRCYNDSGEIGCPAKGNNFFGQDAQYAEAGFCVHQSFSIDTSVADEETIIDNNTMLEWQKSSSPEESLDGYRYCNNLVYGGHEDWRLPTLDELLTIADYSQYDPAINSSYFSVPSGPRYLDVLRTSTYYLGYTWFVAFLDGYSQLASDDMYLSVLCVRGETFPQDFTVSQIGSDKIVKDNFSGLIWQKDYVENKTWQEALEYCENLVYAGFGDWRLPNKNEIVSIANYHGDSDYIFEYSWGLWSSTTSADDALKAWQGYKSYLKTESHPVRCVRSDFCDEGTFWDGTGCITNPCNENSCEGNLSLQCIPTSADEFICACDNAKDGYFWDGSKCTSQCDPNPCENDANSDKTCTAVNQTTYRCGCNENYFWDEGVCKSPCDPNPCENDVNSDKTCAVINLTTHTCGCNENYFWNGSECVNPCNSSSCASEPNSNGNCIPEGAMQYKCECNEGFYWWNGIGCTDRKPLTIGNICTGQTSCYNESSSMTCPASQSGTDTEYNFYGQDASHRDKCTPQSFTASSNVVVDNNTGLIWEKSLSSGYYTWANRNTHCRELNSSIFGGISNWRVPNLLELLTIVDYETSNPATNSNFTEMPTGYYYLLTNSEDRADSLGNFFYALDLHDGYLGPREKTDTFKVLCVSGEEMKPAVSGDFTTSSDGKIVTDNRTGLMWQKEYMTGKTWQQALEYCENLTYADYSDWRLPNKNELISIFNYDKLYPASDFPDMPNDQFWSSSTYISITSVAWEVDSDDGHANRFDKAIKFSVRCVRN